MENHVRRLHLERLSREDWIMIAVAGLLVLDLLVRPWFSGRFGELALGFWLAVLLVGGLVALTRRGREVRAGEPVTDPGPTA
jgi:hypothetical protein